MPLLSPAAPGAPGLLDCAPDAPDRSHVALGQQHRRPQGGSRWNASAPPLTEEASPTCEGLTLTICFLGTSDSYPLHADRLVGRVYDALGGEEFVHKAIIDGPGSGGLDLNRRWYTDRAWSRIMGVTFGAGMGDNVADAMAIIKRSPARADKEDLAAAILRRGPVVRVNLFGHSRGGVQCYRLAWEMYHDPATAHIEVNCIVMDPVPGPANAFRRRNSTFPPNVRHAQVWIAEHEHSLGFEALLPTVTDPMRTTLWLDLLPGNHVNMCVDATLEPLLLTPSGQPTKIRLEPELFRLTFALTTDFLSSHHSQFRDSPTGPFRLTDGEYLRLYDAIARRWAAYCGQASMLEWARATAFERQHMRRMKQHGEFHVCHFTDVDELAEFYRRHRQEEHQEGLPVVNRHHDLLLRHGGDAWHTPASSSPQPPPATNKLESSGGGPPTRVDFPQQHPRPPWLWLDMRWLQRVPWLCRRPPGTHADGIPHPGCNGVQAQPSADAGGPPATGGTGLRLLTTPTEKVVLDKGLVEFVAAHPGARNARHHTRTVSEAGALMATLDAPLVGASAKVPSGSLWLRVGRSAARGRAKAPLRRHSI